MGKDSSPTPVDDPVGTAKIYKGDTIPTDGTPPLDKSQKLTNGDYDIQMGDGRTVGLHVPPNPNGSVMYVLQGSMNPQFKQEDFAKQTQNEC